MKGVEEGIELIADTQGQPYIVKLLVGLVIVLGTVTGVVGYQVFSISKENIKVIQQGTNVNEKLIDVIVKQGKEKERSDQELKAEMKEIRAEIRALKR